MLLLFFSWLQTSSIAKTTTGNTAADNKGGRCITVTADQSLTTATTSSSRPPQTSDQPLIRKCPQGVFSHVDTKDSERQSLVSPKTLLNGTAVPAGLSTTRAKVPTEASPLALGRCPLPRSSVGTNTFKPSSTTFSCLSNQIPLNHPTQTAVAEHFSLEMGDRCGSYDDVVLDGDSEVTSEAEGQSVSGYAEFDDGCSVWEEPRDPHLLEGLFTSEHQRATSFEGNFIHQAVINESSMMSKSTKINGHNVSVRNASEARRQSLIPGPSPFAVPRSVTHDLNSDRRNAALDASMKPPAKSRGSGEFSKNTKSLNASLQFRSLHLVPDKSSTPRSSVAPPKTFVPPHTGHKGAVRPYFQIFSETPCCRSLRAPTGALSSRSVNTLSAHANASSVTAAKKGGQTITSPLCLCGRRAKRQLVSNGGPNHGRGFYCCPVRRSVGGGQVQKGCEFFKWESALMKSCSLVSPAALPSCRSSVSLCHIRSSRSARPPQSSIQRKSF